MFRVTGGSVRGRKLKGPKGYQFRPTAGLVKDYIFSSLLIDVKGSRTLDLFAGVGSLGIEAISRGAEEAIFIERSPDVLRILKNNIHLCGFSNQSKIYRADVFHFMEKMQRQKEQFDLIFADPPYKHTLRQRIVRQVDINGLLKKEGLLILEHGQDDPDIEEHGLKLIKQKVFGHCIVSIYGEEKK